MAEEQTPTVEEKKMLHVIVDQDGVFLRIEQGEQELEQNVDFELYEEEVDKDEDEEDEPAAGAAGSGESEPEKDPGTPPSLATGDPCPDCSGSGLKDRETKGNLASEMCPSCNGSGKVQ